MMGMWDFTVNHRAQHSQFNARHPIVLYDIKEILSYCLHSFIDTSYQFAELCVAACFN